MVEGRAALLDIVQRSVSVCEAAMPRPWTFGGSSPFVDRLLGQVVGFRIEIDRLEGKWKLSQNHPAGRREKVIRALEARGGGDAQAVAEMMRAMLPNGG